MRHSNFVGHSLIVLFGVFGLPGVNFAQAGTYAARPQAIYTRTIYGPYGRLDTTKLMCFEAQDVVLNLGAVVMDTSIPYEPGLIFDRYVVDRAHCAGDEITQPVWVMTFDIPRCFIGYVCRPQDDNQG